MAAPSPENCFWANRNPQEATLPLVPLSSPSPGPDLSQRKAQGIKGQSPCLEVDKAMATHSSALAWKIPWTWTEEPGGLQSMGSRRVGHDWATSPSLYTFMHWRGNGNPLQYSCLENPRDRGAWWAAVFGVAQSRTRLTWLSSSSSSLPWGATSFMVQFMLQRSCRIALKWDSSEVTFLLSFFICSILLPSFSFS